MRNKIYEGILFSASASFWWGVLGVFYFKYVSFAGPVELVIHRTIWTSFVLIITTSIFSKWKIFFKILSNKKKTFLLFMSGFLIYANWSIWIYAVVTNRLVDASFGYYIFPILSVLFGIIFFKEKINRKRTISIGLVIVAIIYLLINLKSIPWIGLTVAVSWSTYNLVRKKANVESDIGLFIESLFVVPVVLFLFYLIVQKGLNDFTFTNPKVMFLLFLAGPMTVIPLYLYVRSIKLAGLGPSGMVFFITPTCQFLLGIFYYQEEFNINKLIGFILIWIAVIIYLRDLKEKKKNA